MKRFAVLTIVLTATACGSSKDGGGQAPAVAQPHSMLVADAGALPECTAAAEGWLVYVKAEDKFKACAGGTWIDVGASIEEKSSRLEAIDFLFGAADAPNLCTTKANEECYFMDGAAKTYSDGLVEFSARILKSADNDLYSTYVDAGVCLPTDTVCPLHLMSISRGTSGTDKSLMLVYWPATKAFKIVYDANDNEKADDSGDEEIMTLTVKSQFKR